MKADNFNLADYLSRIGYEGEVQADVATLTRLMQQQLRSIPFENTEVQTPHGCKILVDNELKLIEEGVLEKLEVDYESALKEYFGLEPFRVKSIF